MRALGGIIWQSGFRWGRHLHSPVIRHLPFSISGHGNRENGCQRCVRLEGERLNAVSNCKHLSVSASGIPRDGCFLTLISEWWLQNQSDKLGQLLSLNSEGRKKGKMPEYFRGRELKTPVSVNAQRKDGQIYLLRNEQLNPAAFGTITSNYGV